MILVNDIWNELERVLATCDAGEIYARLNESVQMLKNTGLWDPLIGRMDICTHGNQCCEITLPDDVQAPLAINVGGQPADFRNKWFEFHLNGPGSDCCDAAAGFSWDDKGNFPTFRDPHNASYVLALPDVDEGPGVNIRIYGYDQNNKWIMTLNPSTGTLEDGFDVPVLYGSWTPSIVKVKRVTRVSKPVTIGFVRLVALDMGAPQGGTLFGYFKPSDTEPQFRRIKIKGAGCYQLCHFSPSTSWVRMMFRRKVFVINSKMDLIPLNSWTSIKMACMAIRKYENDLSEEFAKYKALAVEELRQDQKANNGPNQVKVQMQRVGFMSRTGENMI